MSVVVIDKNTRCESPQALLDDVKSVCRNTQIQLPGTPECTPRSTVATFEAIEAEISDINGSSINVLDMPLPNASFNRPTIIEPKDCRLLSKVLDWTAQSVMVRKVPDRRQWALLGHGALSVPHMDACGYYTFFHVNRGRCSFAWLSQPDQGTLEDWIENEVDSYSKAKGRWCYVTLKPGNFVYFPAGKVHAVYRKSGDPTTVITGGHFLRFSTVLDTASICQMQRRNDGITNEEVDVYHIYCGPLPAYYNKIKRN